MLRDVYLFNCSPELSPFSVPAQPNSNPISIHFLTLQPLESNESFIWTLEASENQIRSKFDGPISMQYVFSREDGTRMVWSKHRTSDEQGRALLERDIPGYATDQRFYAIDLDGPSS